MNKVAIEGGGPIEGTFEFALDGPGAYEVRGDHGVGKSTTLAGLEMLAGHKVSLTLNDNAVSGRVTGFGRVVPIASRKRAKGQLDFEVLDTSRFRMEDMIRPDGKNPETRDKQRLQALAAMTGVRVEPGDFGLLAEEIDPSTDPVLVSNRAKAHFDKRAKSLEDEAKKLTSQAVSKLSISEGVDLDAPHDGSELSKTFYAAVRALAVAEQQRKDCESSQKAADEAKGKLSEIDESGPAAAELQEGIDKKSAQIAELEEQLAKLKSDKKHEEKQLEARKEKDRQLVELRAIVESSVADAPSDEQIEELTVARKDAEEAMEYGVRVRDALEAKESASKLTADADALMESADAFRDQAKGVFETLARKLQLHTMRVEAVDGHLRLLVQHEKRKKPVFVDDAMEHGGLSCGEKVRTILDELVHRFKDSGKPGLVVVDQTSWQELSTEVRKELAEYAEEHNLYLWGAQITEGPLEVVKL